MEWLINFKSKINNFFWELSHTLINYLFGLSIKNELKINPNCYIFLKPKRNRLQISINYVKYLNQTYFNSLICNKIIGNFNKSLVPTLNIDFININPKLDEIFKKQNISKFKKWLNSSSWTYSSIIRLENIIEYLCTNCRILVKKIIIDLDKFKINII